MPATIPYRGNVIVARVAASHSLVASYKIAPKGRSYKIARVHCPLYGGAASHSLVASYMIAPKGRSYKIARMHCPLYGEQPPTAWLRPT